MNIFVLDLNIKKCARYHADQHVVKMILESAQMLCTVLNQAGVKTPYRSTHLHHPCTLWAGASLRNWQWLRSLSLALNDEFRYRFGKTADHQSARLIKALPAPPLPDSGLTEFAQAMPQQYRAPGDAVLAYRRFYIGDKSRFAVWTRRRVPPWFRQGVAGRK